MPEGSKKSRLKSYTDLDENSSFLRLPNIEGAEYLVSLLSEAGFVYNTGMACTSLPWTEIDSWLRVTQLDLSMWEKLTIKTMSEIYAGELGLATAKNRPAPYTYEDEELVADRTLVTSKLKNVFASIRSRKSEDTK